jgi:hypothetical protein
MPRKGHRRCGSRRGRPIPLKPRERPGISVGVLNPPRDQAAAAKEWRADRRAELLPAPYFHVVFTLPGPIADIAYQNKAVVYDLLLKVSAETLITIAADPKHLGARIGPAHPSPSRSLRRRWAN